jgi:hypothetical protein
MNHTKNLPLINTDDIGQKKPKPLKRGGTEEAEKSKDLDHKGHEGTQRRLRGDCQKCQNC